MSDQLRVKVELEVFDGGRQIEPREAVLFVFDYDGNHAIIDIKRNKGIMDDEFIKPPYWI